MLKNVAAN